MLSETGFFANPLFDFFCGKELAKIQKKSSKKIIGNLIFRESPTRLLLRFSRDFWNPRKSGILLTSPVRLLPGNKIFRNAKQVVSDVRADRVNPASANRLVDAPYSSMSHKSWALGWEQRNAYPRCLKRCSTPMICHYTCGAVSSNVMHVKSSTAVTKISLGPSASFCILFCWHPMSPSTLFIENFLPSR